jgi:hypothetical protein
MEDLNMKLEIHVVCLCEANAKKKNETGREDAVVDYDDDN